MRVIILLYGVIAYVLFFLSFLYLIVFIGPDFSSIIGTLKTVDAGEPASRFAPAALTNIILLLLFAISHSVMARPGFKRGWTKIVPPAAERPTYVLVATAFLVLIFHYWQPMPTVVWDVGPGIWATLLTVLYFVGFGMVLLSTFLLNHFQLFGLSQIWHNFNGSKPAPDNFRTPMLYKSTRHPLYLGFVIAFWAVPTMTAGHLLFSAIWTIYIFIGIGYEERDLISAFGDKYHAYMAKVPMLFPIGRRK